MIIIQFLNCTSFKNNIVIWNWYLVFKLKSETIMFTNRVIVFDVSPVALDTVEGGGAGTHGTPRCPRR